MDVVITIAEFNRHMESIGYAENTIEGYKYGLKCFKSFLDEKGISDLKKVNHKLILEYQARIRKKGGAEETLAIKARAVKRLFEYLVEGNRLLINPAEGIVETNRQKRKTGSVLTVKEMTRLLEQPNLSIPSQIRDRTMIELFYSTGIRSNELFTLHVYDVNLKERVLFIRKGKGKRQRVVPFGKTAGTWLREYLEKVRPRHVKRNPKQRILFVTVEGNPMNSNAFRAKMNVYRKQARIKTPIGLHIFRRTCATHMLQNGADILYIQKMLGHKYLKTTQAYTKIIPVDVKNTHNKTHPNTGKEDKEDED